MKAIIFDLDGVIVSTDEQHYLGWQALADRLGIPFGRETNNRFRGVSRMACMDILEQLGGKHYSKEEKEAYASWKMIITAACWLRCRRMIWTRR